MSQDLVTLQAEPWEIDLDPRTTALMVIDMQNDFTLPGGYCHQYMEARGMGDEAIATLRTPIEPIQRTLEAARGAGMKVIYTIESHWADLSDAGPAKMDGTIRVGAPIGAQGPHGRNLVRGDWGTEVIEELTPLPHEHLLHKAGKGGFVATDLDLILRSAGITHLVFTGITTDCCVLFTRQGAYDRGYYTIQLEDACAASVKANHDAVFSMIRTHPEAFGLMASSDAFIEAFSPVAAAHA